MIAFSLASVPKIVTRGLASEAPIDSSAVMSIEYTSSPVEQPATQMRIVSWLLLPSAILGNTSVRSAILSAQYDQEARSRRGVSLDALRARDPNLTDQSIIDRVRRMSDVLREAWVNGNMAPARAFVSDGVYSRFQVQLALMRQEGVRNVMSDAAVLYVTMEGAQSSPPLAAVHVRYAAQARDVLLASRVGIGR